MPAVKTVILFVLAIRVGGEMIWIKLIVILLIMFGAFWLFAHTLFGATEENDEIADRNL